MKEKIKRFIRKINTNWFLSEKLFLVAVMIIIPMIILAFFNHPGADDFCYQNQQNMHGYWQSQVNLLKWQNGRFVSSLLITLPFLLKYQLVFYKLMPVLLILITIFALQKLANKIFFEADKKVSWILAMLFFCIYFVGLSSVNSAFYWLASTMTYQVSIILFLLFLNYLISMYQNRNKMNWLLTFAFGFLILGTSEISIFMINFIILLVLVSQFLKNEKIDIYFLSLLILFSVIAYFVAFSKGNDYRGTLMVNSKDLFYSLYKSTLTFKSYLLIWIPLVTVSGILFLDYVIENNIKLKFEWIKLKPIVVLIIILFYSFFSFFIGYWSMGFILPPRAINLVFFYFFLGFLFFLLNIKNDMLEKKNKWSIPLKLKWLLFIVFLMQIFQSSNFKDLYFDLLTGKAKKYDKEMNSRYQVMLQSTNDTVIFSPLKNIPKTLYNGDLKEDASHWVNDCFGYFYQKKVRIENNSNTDE